MDKVLWLLLGILGVTLALLIFAESNGAVFGIQSDNFANFAYLGALVAALVVGGSFSRVSISLALRNAAIWMALIFCAAAIYTYSDTIQAMVAGRF